MTYSEAKDWFLKFVKDHPDMFNVGANKRRGDWVMMNIDEAARLILAAREQRSQPSGWISVEQPPMETGLFLGFVPPNIMGACMFVKGSWLWPDQSEDREAIGLTHWQPLPVLLRQLEKAHDEKLI